MEIGDCIGQCEIVSYFNEYGFALVNNGQKQGITDRKGNLVLPCEYEINNGDWNRASAKGICIRKEGLYGLLDPRGCLMAPCIYENEVFLLVPGFLLVKEQGKLGVVKLDQLDEYFLECRFSSITVRYESEYKIGCIEEKDESKRCFFVACTEKTLLVKSTYREEYVLCEVDFVLDIHLIYGNYIVCSVKHDQHFIFSIFSIVEKRFLPVGVCDKLGYWDAPYLQIRWEYKWGLFDMYKGKLILPCLFYEGFEYPYVQMNVTSKSYYALDYKSWPKGKLLFDDSGYAVVHWKDSMGYVTKECKVVFGRTFEEAMSFKEGFAAVKIKGKWGFIDEQGKLICRPIFTDVRNFKNGFAAVLLDGVYPYGWSFIDVKGNLMRTFYERVLDFSEGLAAVKQNGKWGYIDGMGNVVIPYHFVDAESFSEGLAAVAFKKKWGFIDRYNRTIVRFIYDMVSAFYDGQATVYIGEDYGCIDKEGKVIDWHEHPCMEDEVDCARETWGAMTDGMYGDYPGNGVDYDWID